jgi:outer membrane lipoprotein
MSGRHIIPLALSLLLCACATGPAFDTVGVDYALTPRTVAAKPQAATGKKVRWGGTILDSARMPDRTRLEVMAFPLDTAARPILDYNPTGRFMLERAGHLDPAAFREGRQITAVGVITGTRTGRVGETDYAYPLLDASQLHLWSGSGSGYRRSDGVSIFGTIGGGSSSGGGGISIGF